MNAQQMRPTLDEMAASVGLGYIETFTRDRLPYVTVYEGDHQYGRGDALIEVVADFGEHPHALLRRALAQAEHARKERQLRAELDRLRPPADLPATLASVDDMRRVCDHYEIREITSTAALDAFELNEKSTYSGIPITRTWQDQSCRVKASKHIGALHVTVESFSGGAWDGTGSRLALGVVSAAIQAARVAS